MNNRANISRYLGFDGAANVEAMSYGAVRFLNAAKKVCWLPHEISDWVMSLEVGEHIDAKYESTFVDNLHRANRKGIILSWGLVGQGGHSHVNLESTTTRTLSR
jgi:hypothetical protein